MKFIEANRARPFLAYLSFYSVHTPLMARELAGLPLQPAHHRDGVSLVPFFRGGELARGPLFWHYLHYGNQGGAPGGAVRDGDWKLIEWYEDGSFELFNLRHDLGEQTSLAVSEPDRVKALHEKLKAWREAVGAKMPTPNPKFRQSAGTQKSAGSKSGQSDASGKAGGLKT